MRIIFMGTPDFASPTLEALLKSKHEVVSVYCQPDKPKGRGHKMQSPPVKELASEMNIPVCQPNKLRNEETYEEIRNLNPDVIVVVAYGKILPKEILDIPRYGCINVHASLLPKYRGAAPIQWAVINGEKTTGVTTMYMGEGLDTGDMLMKEETEILENETAGELFDRLKYIGADLLIETLDKLESNSLNPEKQDDSKATLAPMLTKDDGKINWNNSAESIKNLIYGTNPWPSAFAFLGEDKMKIHEATVVNETGDVGEIKVIDKELVVCCKEKALRLDIVQPMNSKRMDGKSYLLGHDIEGKQFS